MAVYICNYFLIIVNITLEDMEIIIKAEKKCVCQFDD